MVNNLMALESELMAHLVQALAGMNPPVHVLCAADLADVREEQQLTPAVQVIYHGARITQVRSDGRAARVTQTWLLVVATRNVRSLKSGAEARASAGVLGAAVAKAVMGWRAPSAATPCLLTQAPAAGFSAGHQYLPLAIEAELVLQP